MKKLLVLILIVTFLVSCSGQNENAELIEKIDDQKEQIGILDERINEYEEALKEKNKKINDLEGSNSDNKEIDQVKSKKAKELLDGLEDNVIKALKEKDYKKLSELVHPAAGVRFSPYSYVDRFSNIVLTNDSLKLEEISSVKKLWGNFDGSGKEIRMSVDKYFDEFVYQKDYKNADKITYNTPQNTGNSIDNHLKVYGKCISVDYHFEGTEENNGMDWKTLRLIFKEYNGKYYLIGIINNEWTI